MSSATVPCGTTALGNTSSISPVSGTVPCGTTECGNAPSMAHSYLHAAAWSLRLVQGCSDGEGVRSAQSASQRMPDREPRTERNCALGDGFKSWPQQLAELQSRQQPRPGTLAPGRSKTQKPPKCACAKREGCRIRYRCRTMMTYGKGYRYRYRYRAQLVSLFCMSYTCLLYLLVTLSFVSLHVYMVCTCIRACFMYICNQIYACFVDQFTDIVSNHPKPETRTEEMLPFFLTPPRLSRWPPAEPGARLEAASPPPSPSWQPSQFIWHRFDWIRELRKVPSAAGVTLPRPIASDCTAGTVPRYPLSVSCDPAARSKASECSMLSSLQYKRA